MQKTACRATALASLIVLAASAGILAMPFAASAAQVEGVTSVVIQPPNPDAPDAPLRGGQTVRVDVTWSVPDSTVTGDTFTLAFPPEIRAFTARFDLVNPEGTTVGECVVATPNFLCTMNNYVLTHNSVSGGLRFYARASGTTENDSVDFITGDGRTIPAALPGGAIVTPGGSAPSRPGKYGYVRSNGSAAEWTVSIPGPAAASADGSAIEFTDTWDSALTFQPETLRVGYVAADDWNNGDYWSSVVFLTRGTTANTYAFSDESASSRVRFAFNEPVTDGSRIYVVRYSTAIPSDAADGTVFENTVAAPGGQQVAADTVSFLRASGEGAGVVEEVPAIEPEGELPTLPLPVDSPTTTAADSLAETGADSDAIQRTALFLLVLGAAFLLLARRRAAVSERR